MEMFRFQARIQTFINNNINQNITNKLEHSGFIDFMRHECGHATISIEIQFILFPFGKFYFWGPFIRL